MIFINKFMEMAEQVYSICIKAFHTNNGENDPLISEDARVAI